jgi:hypothetical protein
LTEKVQAVVEEILAQEPQDLKDHRESKERLDPLDPLDHKVTKDLRGSQA